MGSVVAQVPVNAVEQMDESEMLGLICGGGKIVYEARPRVIACTEHVLSELGGVPRVFAVLRPTLQQHPVNGARTSSRSSANSWWRRWIVESDGMWVISPVATKGSSRSMSLTSSPPRSNASAKEVIVEPTVCVRFGFCRPVSASSMVSATAKFVAVRAKANNPAFEQIWRGDGAPISMVVVFTLKVTFLTGDL